MGEIYAAAGSRFFIGGQMTPETDMVEGDFDSETWVEVDPLEGFDDFGDEAEEVTFQAMNRNRVQKRKGTRNAGTVAVVAARNDADEGQEAMLDAEASNFNYAFKIEYPDAPEGGTPSTDYFVGLVMSKRVTGGDGANNVLMRNFNIGINSNIVEVAAAAGGS